MKTFQSLWPITNAIPGSFTELNAIKLYEYALKVPDGGIIVEVGVDQGRSASVLMEAARGRDVTVILVDAWESVLIDNYHKVKALVDCFGDRVALFHGYSVPVSKMVDGPIDMLHIDANHYDDNPMNDMIAWLPKLKNGGVACFHDYQCTFPAVDVAVDTCTIGWGNLGVWDCLAIRRKP